MTRKGPTKKADIAASGGRLSKARAFHKAARDAMSLAEDADIADPIVSHVVLAAIAYADALTAHFAEEINQKDHAAAVRLLRAALGKEFPDEQERRLSRMIGRKDAAQYGVRTSRKSDAEKLLADLEKFAD